MDEEEVVIITEVAAAPDPDMITMVVDGPESAIVQVCVIHCQLSRCTSRRGFNLYCVIVVGIYMTSYQQDS